MVYTTKGVFQSTRPVRGATSLSVSVCVGSYSFNPRAPCGARHVATIDSFRCVRVSIHAPRAGRDLIQTFLAVVRLLVSIHAPRAGRDHRADLHGKAGQRFNPRAPCGARHSGSHRQLKTPKFQSTRPVRGATGASLAFSATSSRFNPRAPCGARPSVRILTRSSCRFNPRAPCGARLICRVKQNKCSGVSIHAPRAGRDGVRGWGWEGLDPVSIHAPRAGRDP